MTQMYNDCKRVNVNQLIFRYQIMVSTNSYNKDENSTFPDLNWPIGVKFVVICLPKEHLTRLKKLNILQKNTHSKRIGENIAIVRNCKQNVEPSFLPSSHWQSLNDRLSKGRFRAKYIHEVL